MGRIRRTQQAKEDLVEILKHLRGLSEKAADRVADEIDQKLHLLAQFPMLGTARDEFSFGLRSAATGNHVIFFRPLSDGIRVIRILYGRRDFTAINWE